MTLFHRLRRELIAWGKTEGMGWVFVLKTTIASLLAMGISMRLELGQPVTAMITVYVVMQPQTGLVLTKSFYRICGTAAGTLVSLLLLGFFSQERVLFLLGLALWIGLCTAGAALYRNFKSYGFTLAGYTAAMIALPLVMQPTGFFNFAVNRATEVMIGIICAGIVSDVIFPRSLGCSIMAAMQVRYSELIHFARAVFSGTIDAREFDRMHLQFIGNVVNLESLRSSALLEASQIRGRDLRLRRLNADFMALSTTFHSFYQLLNRLKKGDAPTAQALSSFCAALVETLLTDGEPAESAVEAKQAERRLAAFRAGFPVRVEAARDSAEGQVKLDFETGVELLYRLVRELHDYTRTYAYLAEERHTSEPLEEVRFASRTDPVLALLTGARAALVTLLVAVFWIVTAWPNGASAVMMAAIGSAIFAPTPDPALAVKTGLMGTLAAFAAAILCKFFVLTSMDGLGMLCAGMLPFLLVGPYLALNPKLAAIGLGYSSMFCFMIAPANRMQYDPAGLINFGTALMLGLSAAAVVFATFAPVTGAWLKRRTSRMLRLQVEMACFGPISNLGPRFESGTRDLLQRVAGRQIVQDSHDRNIVDWMFVVLEVGRAVIHLRHDAEDVSMSQELLDSVKNSLKATARLFRQPNARSYAAALQGVEHSIEAILSESAREGLSGHTRNSLHRMLTSLHLIRTSLLDDETVLAARVAWPQAILQGETSHAA